MVTSRQVRLRRVPRQARQGGAVQAVRRVQGLCGDCVPNLVFDDVLWGLPSHAGADSGQQQDGGAPSAN